MGPWGKYHMLQDTIGGYCTACDAAECTACAPAWTVHCKYQDPQKLQTQCKDSDPKGSPPPPPASFSIVIDGQIAVGSVRTGPWVSGQVPLIFVAIPFPWRTPHSMPGQPAIFLPPLPNGDCRCLFCLAPTSHALFHSNCDLSLTTFLSVTARQASGAHGMAAQECT